MRILKDINEALSADKRIEQFFDFLTDGKFEDIKDNFYFYKIRGSIEKGILTVEMYFEHKEKWYKLGKIDLENNKVLQHIDKKIFKSLLYYEDKYIMENYHKEIQRTTNIILSLIALILGVMFALLVIQFFK
ncbi:hypothetical protein [Hydrogenivirga sp. 128-5-R1-1]|uniref:hypothetical protein n=1 Tax=Hydrogenivirga sp. 128-5-R1-1 TaxID=392423 RepID=UPI00015F31E0|nr:hypothetical protein [Hydrogenivirga sp. 128-5-R1-1]EDP73662.1 hypothetical protein HG1285_04443 [Hydrogenivirga sp. 128-5-R1-1]